MPYLSRDYVHVRCRDGLHRPFLLPRWIRATRPAETVPNNLYECGKCGIRVTLRCKGDLARHRCLEDIEEAMGAAWMPPAGRSSDAVGDCQSREFVGLVAAFEDAYSAEQGEAPTTQVIAKRVQLRPPYLDAANADAYAKDVFAIIAWNECYRRGEC